MYRISVEESRAIRQRMGKTKDKNGYKKLQAVALRGEGYGNEEIGKITDIHPDMVGRYAKRYKEAGIESLLTEGRCGGNNQNMSEAEATEFLRQFEESAEKGEIVTVKSIAGAYDEATGKTRESKSTVYNFLHKHGWRIVTPRPKHPESASEEEVEASKKR